MYSSAYVWAKVLSHMEERLGSVTVSAWFDDAEVVELNENNLILYSPSDFRRDIIRRRCTGYVEDALKEVFNSDAKLLVFGDKERDSFRNKGKAISSMDFNPQPPAAGEAAAAGGEIPGSDREKGPADLHGSQTLRVRPGAVQQPAPQGGQ